MPKIALVALENATISFDRLFSYLISDKISVDELPGKRVIVPFGSANKRRQGMVIRVEEQDSGKALKPIYSVLDHEPVLNAEMLLLAEHLRETVFCTYYDAVKLLIPAGLQYRVEHSYSVNPEWGGDLSEKESELFNHLLHAAHPVSARRILEKLNLSDDGALLELYKKGALLREEDVKRRVMDEKVVMVRLTGNEHKLTAKQREVYDFLSESGSVSVREVLYYTSVTRVVVDNMQSKGVVEYYEREVYRNPYGGEYEKKPLPELSEGQEAAYLELLKEQQRCEPVVSLLYGVTGSGKTEVFLKLAQQVVRGGKTVLVLVPEISLTPQTIERFHSLFGGEVAVVHSALSLGERADEYKRISRGEVKVVVGTRSAVLSPLLDIGLIIIDEEQSDSYKSEKSPRFHARDVARWRAAYHKTQLVLASATPSVESFYLAKAGRYHLVTLRSRFTGSALPDVYIIDPREDMGEDDSSVLTARLCDELSYNLKNSEQSILLLNRRGYHTMVKCANCMETAKCPHCSVTLTYHSQNDALCCHYCGYQQIRTMPCKHCGGKLVRYSGAGTQRVEEELNRIFPSARVLRMDMDTTMQKFSHERLFGEFSEHKYDIMIGTQMVAKGLNFPDVTLVGVLTTDSALYSDDFRSFERTFSLLTQVVGRAGRSEKKGRAFIQTYSPDNPVIELAASQQYERFYGIEIESRHLGLYPPFCDIVALGLTGEDERLVSLAAKRMLEITKETARSSPEMPLRVLGPSEFLVYKLAGRYRKKLLIKCRNNRALRVLIRGIIDTAAGDRAFSKVNIFVDVYYDSF